MRYYIVMNRRSNRFNHQVNRNRRSYLLFPSGQRAQIVRLVLTYPPNHPASPTNQVHHCFEARPRQVISSPFQTLATFFASIASKRAKRVSAAALPRACTLHAHPHTHAHPPTNAYTKTYTCADAGAGAGAEVGYRSFGRCCGFVAARDSGRSTNS